MSDLVHQNITYVHAHLVYTQTTNYETIFLTITLIDL